jgi:hypothetical protein
VLLFTCEAETVQVLPDDQVALKVPVPEPAGTWLLMKCHVPVKSPHDCPLKLLMVAASAIAATLRVNAAATLY